MLFGRSINRKNTLPVVSRNAKSAVNKLCLLKFGNVVIRMGLLVAD